MPVFIDPLTCVDEPAGWEAGTCGEPAVWVDNVDKTRGWCDEHQPSSVLASRIVKLSPTGDAALTLGDHCERMVSAIHVLHYNNAEHKRGFKLAEQRPRKALMHALEEVGEIIEADAYGDPQDAAEELGDALACLFHYAVSAGIDLADLMRWWLEE